MNDRAKKTTIGTWTLNAGETRRAEGPDPLVHEIQILEDDGDYFSMREKVVSPAGEELAFAWSGPSDGQFRPTSGADFEVAFTRPANAAYAYEWRGLGRSGSEIVTVDADGRKLVCKGFVNSPSGRVPNDYVFDRVEK